MSKFAYTSPGAGDGVVTGESRFAEVWSPCHLDLPAGWATGACRSWTTIHGSRNPQTMVIFDLFLGSIGGKVSKTIMRQL